MKYISTITGQIWTEKELVADLENLYSYAESNFRNYKAPKNILERVIKVYQLEELEKDNVHNT